MTRFPQPSQRLIPLSVYVARARVIGTSAVVRQMQADGKSIADAAAVMRAARTGAR